jgi:DNA (cytosine-5)-methyltransferase 1
MLYQEIIFLKHHYKGKYCIENVVPYYEPLIPGQKRGRHIYWTNFKLPNNISENTITGVMCGQTNDEFKKLCKFHKVDLSTYKGKQSKLKIVRNLVDYKVGLSIFNIAKGIYDTPLKKQINLF